MQVPVLYYEKNDKHHILWSAFLFKITKRL
jgi:hypothetical protein